MNQRTKTIRLIVNADDFGYFNSVSKGILEGAREGVITATGIMANSPLFDQHIQWLNQVPQLDLGVHLNATQGQPLSETLRHKLASLNGQFPTKYALVGALLSGKISISDIATEWRAQITRCIEAGITLQFLNSHEHLHMLPPLFKVIKELALEFNIPNIRYSKPEIKGQLNLNGAIRNIIMLGLNLFNRRANPSSHAIKFIGMNESGNLTLDYFKAVFPSMKGGCNYELMCHPGYMDPLEIIEPELLAYHHWEAELTLLQSNDFKQLCQTHGIALVKYSDLGNGSTTRTAADLT
jgi:predicted glycoside hydrolase/deacetylase ChbG (UPF0249 family)